MVHMPVPKWGKGKHLYIAFHDGAVLTEEGVEFPYPPDQGIRIIHNRCIPDTGSCGNTDKVAIPQ